VLPPHLDAAIDTGSWAISPLFRFLMEKGGLGLADARRSFNLGVGMVLIVRGEDAGATLAELHAAGEAAWVMGELVAGSGQVVYR
jgi:phosphoribosylformylglycinamidine cyclo-ligase